MPSIERHPPEQSSPAPESGRFRPPTRLASSRGWFRSALITLALVAPTHRGCECEPTAKKADPRPKPAASAHDHGARLLSILKADLPDAHESGNKEHMTHHAHPDMKAMYEKEVAHPFHQNPEKWLDEHAKDVEACFASTGERVLRVPGSGVLKDRAAWVNNIAKQVKGIEQETGAPVNVIVEAHDACGAAGIAYKGKENPDELARDFDKTLVAELQAAGVNAVYGGDSGMNGMQVHNALGVTLDFTQGRMQHPPFNSFAVSSPDIEGIVADAMLALKIAAGDHSYDSHLKQFTFLAFVDPAHAAQAEKALAEIDRQAEPFRAKGIDVRIVRRTAPAQTKKSAVKTVRVQCIDERVLRKTGHVAPD